MKKSKYNLKDIQKSPKCNLINNFVGKFNLNSKRQN